MKRQRIDLWYVLLDKAAGPSLEAEYRSLLSADEIRRYERLIPPEARHQNLVSRAFLRTVLTHYAEVEPGGWEFQFSAHGKPSIGRPAGLPWEFNVSHTRGLVVCAVSRDHEIGVDVERCDHKLDHLGLARRFFHASETAILQDLPREAQRETFFQIWTLKEAYLKACGTGLSTPLDSFAFSLPSDGPPQIAWTVPNRQPADEWHFGQLRLVDCYEIALAIRLPAEQGFEVRMRQTVPLRGEDDWRELPDRSTNRWMVR